MLVHILVLLVYLEFHGFNLMYFTCISLSKWLSGRYQLYHTLLQVELKAAFKIFLYGATF